MTKQTSYGEIFCTQFPYYLSIGMTEGQYWDGDAVLAKHYRKAEELRRERANRQAWLQGMYVYDAIARLLPVMHAFAKKGAKAEPYVPEPYPLNERERKQAEREKEKRAAQSAARYMQAFALQNNKRFERKE